MLRSTVGPKWRASLESALALALALLGFLVGPILNGRVGWIHAHGEHREHVHLVPQPELDADDVLAEWHETQHHDEDDPHDEPPPGIIVQLPAMVAAPTTEASWIALAAIDPIPLAPSFQWDLGWIEGLWESEFYPSSWPPQDRWRSGVEELLRSSHALLI
jgi:hypothetical protein